MGRWDGFVQPPGTRADVEKSASDLRARVAEIKAATSNIVRLPVITNLDLDADQILVELLGKLKGFVLVGYAKDGTEFFSSTYADGGDALWLLERCKLSLLNAVDE